MVTLPSDFEEVIKQQTEQLAAALAEASGGRLGSGFNVQETVRLFVAAVMGSAEILLAVRSAESDDYISRTDLVAWLRERGSALAAGQDPAAAEVFRLADRLEHRLPLGEQPLGEEQLGEERPADRVALDIGEPAKEVCR
jgi:hypothetical protein